MSENSVRIYDTSLALLAEVDLYERAYFRRAWSACGNFSITLSSEVVGSEYLQEGNFIMIGGDAKKAGKIASVHKTGAGSATKITAAGLELKGLFARRAIVPAAGSPDFTSTGPAETVMKELIANQCGTSAALERRFSLLTVPASTGLGDTYYFRNRWSGSLLDALQSVSETTELGYWLELDETLKKYIVKVGVGTDRTVEQVTNPRAIFSPDYDTQASADYLLDRAGYKSLAYVAGQGEGVARTIRTVYLAAAEPTGEERFETFIDARDLSSTGDLDTRGAQILTEAAAVETFDCIPLTRSTLTLDEDYFLGDYVTVQAFDETANKQIVEVMEEWAHGKYTLSATFGNPPADFRKQLRDAIVNIRNGMNYVEVP